MNKIRVMLVGACALALTACSGLLYNTRGGVSSSLVDFLYPKGEEPPPRDNVIPQLNLPLRVGLAFVPASRHNKAGLSEAQKLILLNRVKAAFKEREFIQSISVIPDTYLRSSRGFQTVDQVARLYNLDTIALVSYDQISHTDETKASIAYWTIVGAYFIKGNVNDVQTFVDTAVFDVRTHKLLFRAPGVDESRGTSTMVNLTEEVRKRRAESFDKAMVDMTQNLDNELNVFIERVKTEQVAKVVHRPGYTGGGGGLGWWLIFPLLLIALRNTQPGALQR